MKNWILNIIAVLFFQFGFCQSNGIEDYDSIVSYQIKKKETLFNISKKFKINIEDIFLFNPELRGKKLKKNSIINIPLKRIKKNNLKEVIIATSATVEGQTTAHYIEDTIKNGKIKITKLAQGLPVGGEIEQLDDGTLFSAFKNRVPVTDN